MLEPTKQALLAGRVILASGSPRRKEILENLASTYVKRLVHALVIRAKLVDSQLITTDNNRPDIDCGYVRAWCVSTSRDVNLNLAGSVKRGSFEHGSVECKPVLSRQLWLPRFRMQIYVSLKGIKAEIIPSTYDEDLDRTKYKTHGEYVKDLAYYKVLEVYDRLKDDKIPPSLVIGADTLVTMGDVIYGKPKDGADAFRILSNLAGKQHTVYTGVCLKTPKAEITFYETTKVKFGDISAAQIESYIQTGEPLDKAGGYGIQGIGGCLVEKIDGDFFTVMGLPLYSMTKHLHELYK